MAQAECGMAAAAPPPLAGQSSPQNGLPSAVATIWDTRAVSAATGISASTSAVLSASACGSSSITVHPARSRPTTARTTVGAADSGR